MSEAEPDEDPLAVGGELGARSELEDEALLAGRCELVDRLALLEARVEDLVLGWPDAWWALVPATAAVTAPVRATAPSPTAWVVRRISRRPRSRRASRRSRRASGTGAEESGAGVMPTTIGSPVKRPIIPASQQRKKPRMTAYQPSLSGWSRPGGRGSPPSLAAGFLAAGLVLAGGLLAAGLVLAARGSLRRGL